MPPLARFMQIRITIPPMGERHIIPRSHCPKVPQSYGRAFVRSYRLTFLVRSYGLTVPARSRSLTFLRSYGPTVVQSCSRTVVLPYGPTVLKMRSNSRTLSHNHTLVWSYHPTVIRSNIRTMLSSQGPTVLWTYDPAVLPYAHPRETTSARASTSRLVVSTNLVFIA